MTIRSASRRLPLGTRLDDRFEIVEFLGAGSFGEVYRARQLIFDRCFRDVALKLFAADRVNPANVEDVFADAITLVGLQEEVPTYEVSRHLVQIYDMGLLRTPEPRAFMSMKLVHGKRTLWDPIRQFSSGGGMPVMLSLNYLRQLLIPLAWMHTLDLPVIHGDLKPENILLTDESLVILTDFGLAARMPGGTIGGTMSYEAPEKLAGHEGGEASDIYAVGLIWYEMLTGEHPFKGVDVGLHDRTQLTHGHLVARKWQVRSARPGVLDDDERIPPASEKNTELRDHPQVEAMLNRCLCWAQSERYPNAARLLAHIDTYARSGKLTGEELAVVMRAATAQHETARSPQRNPEAIVANAEALLLQGQVKRAIEEAEKALQIDKRLLAALLVKARSLSALGTNLDEARRLCHEAGKLHPNEPAVLDAEAEVLAKAGKNNQAQQLRLEAARLRQHGSYRGRQRAL